MCYTATIRLISQTIWWDCWTSTISAVLYIAEVGRKVCLAVKLQNDVNLLHARVIHIRQ